MMVLNDERNLHTNCQLSRSLVFLSTQTTLAKGKIVLQLAECTGLHQRNLPQSLMLAVYLEYEMIRLAESLGQFL